MGHATVNERETPVIPEAERSEAIRDLVRRVGDVRRDDEESSDLAAVKRPCVWTVLPHIQPESELDVTLARRYLPRTIDPETDVSDDFKALVVKMAVPHHAGPAFHALLRAGFDALPAIRRGLGHESAEVRRRCCLFLDHFVTQGLMDELVAMLGDPDAGVRVAAAHALACDRCKEGACGPEEAKVLPRAMALLAADPDAHVRAHVIGLVGRWVHTSPAAEAALLRARTCDPSPAVRKRAGWILPGGTIYRKTAPKARKRTRGKVAAA